ncbi:helix-turn-helix domain-containing protein [Poriferisphaera sp. WC338]|uniref:AraC family transcriptional regulator n=1 Tax=Poriferisphaera sp. WC338 TaxID=3425129 RepID=UPI003D818E03
MHIEELPSLRFAGWHTDDCNVSMHRHHCAELILVTRGQCRVVMEGVDYVVGQGELLVVSPDEPHNQVQISHESVRTIYVGFRCASTVFEIRPEVIEVRQHQAVQQLMQMLAENRNDMQGCDLLSASGLLLGLLRMIDQIRMPKRMPMPAHPKLAHALEIVHAHISDPLCVSDLAVQVAISASHLTALFRESFGCGPAQYLLQLRMEVACQHLAEPYLTVKEIAAMCGYENVNLFIRHFKNRHGMSPGKWRSDPDRLDSAISQVITNRA